jgi:uncharacterized protein (AIM24 family)/Flp pilus assembly protein TadD
MAVFPAEGRSSEARTPAGREMSSEDFLFHLYRGSEMLQDNRVHEAKEELEAALRLAPLDPKSQDLIAVVYFRLGMYPRAIEIFERLMREYPDQRTPRINLALCYLKTGQPSAARQLLEATVQLFPDNVRAWGYLGLSYERQGDYEKAREAFLRGGHDGMARRMEDLLGDQEPESVRSPEPFQEIDGDVTDMAQVSLRPPRVPSIRPSRPPPSFRPPPSLAPVSLGAVRGRSVAPPSHAPESIEGPAVGASRPLSALARDLLVAFPRAPSITALPSGVLRVAIASSFACRMDRVPAMGGALAPEIMPRHARGRVLEEPLGGTATPLVKLSGTGYLLLAPGTGHALFPLTMEDEALYVREECLVGFEELVTYENGRAPLGDGESVSLVQLRGNGIAVLELPKGAFTLAVEDGSGLTVRRELLLGWVGGVLPRGLPSGESPGGQRGLVALSGEGTVFLSPALT